MRIRAYEPVTRHRSWIANPQSSYWTLLSSHLSKHVGGIQPFDPLWIGECPQWGCRATAKRWSTSRAATSTFSGFRHRSSIAWKPAKALGRLDSSMTSAGVLACAHQPTHLHEMDAGAGG